jgi:glutathione S-transferase
VVYEFDDWIKVKFKSKFEFNQLPVLEMEGQYFAQSNAILRMLAIKYGYYSQDYLKCWQIDSAVDFISDIVHIYGNQIVFQ